MGFGLTRQVLEAFRRRTGEQWPDEYCRTDVRTLPLPDVAHICRHEDYYSMDPRRSGGYLDAFGVLHLPLGDHEDEALVSPLAGTRSLKDVLDYPMPTFLTQDREQLWKDMTKQIHRNRLAVAVNLCETLFEVAWKIRGLDDFLVDLVTGEPSAETLLDRIFQVRKDLVCRGARSGADILMLGDDVAGQRGMLISPELWRKTLKPRLSELIFAARRENQEVLIFYHSDGNPTEIVPDLIEIGVDILNPVQPECVDIVEWSKRFGDHVSFWGTIGVQTTLPFGSREEVRSIVQDRFNTFGRTGGLLLAPAHMIGMDIPWTNVETLFEAIHEYDVVH